MEDSNEPSYHWTSLIERRNRLKHGRRRIQSSPYNSMPDRGKRRVVLGCTIAGSLLLSVGTYFHPVPADPNDPLMAFAEYAADRLWIASHLAQLAGVTLILAALIVVTQLQAPLSSGLGYQLAGAGAVACLALVAALQAVDGIALKRAVNAWSTASAAEKQAAFYAAFAVRQIEVGLASTLSMLSGVTAILYGFAILSDDAFPNWVAGLGVLGGAATAVAGVLMAYEGFSDLEMVISMPASCILLLWMLIVGILTWRASAPPTACCR